MSNSHTQSKGASLPLKSVCSILPSQRPSSASFAVSLSVGQSQSRKTKIKWKSPRKTSMSNCGLNSVLDGSHDQTSSFVFRSQVHSQSSSDSAAVVVRRSPRNHGKGLSVTCFLANYVLDLYHIQLSGLYVYTLQASVCL